MEGLFNLNIIGFLSEGIDSNTSHSKENRGQITFIFKTFLLILLLQKNLFMLEEKIKQALSPISYL
jgi:hypothetical protein